jgi:prepilin-type N-terminal cleavage/methylation domain-containing protein
MFQKIRNKSEGFTIIEVLIVLAIAALILVVVLIAVPQLQRNQRNSTRRSTLGRIKTELDNYAGNNNGSYPTANNNASTGFNTGGGFPGRYLTGVNTNDPQTGAAMTLATWTADNAVTATGTVYYATGRVCSGETSQAGSARNYIVMTPLEGGAIACLDNA